MNLDAELKKQMKLAARKQHYFAISECLRYIVAELSDAHKAIEALKDMGKLSDAPEEISKAMSFKVISTTIPLFQIARSLKSYHQAFGEYPEWVKFTPFKDHEGLEKFVDLAQKGFEELNKKFGKSKAGEDLLSMAFGPKYAEAVEKVKLKGEV